MSLVQPLRVAGISAVAGAALLAGGFFVTSAFVSAEETPTPSQGQTQTEAAPGDRSDGAGTREDCPKDNADGAQTGIRFRSGDRGLRQ